MSYGRLCVFLGKYAVFLTSADTWGSLTTPTLHPDTRSTTTNPTPDTATPVPTPKPLPPHLAARGVSWTDPPNPGPTFRCLPTPTANGPRRFRASCITSAPGKIPQAAEDSYCRQKAELEGDRRPKHSQSKRRRQKPEKPRPDFPLYPHPSGQWACKFGRQTKYFGPWNDPDGAEQAYQSHITNQCTKAARGGKVGKNSDSPRKPRKNFPFWPHPSGQWAKKINGTTYYFGSWGDPDAAEEKYKRERDDLAAGRIPRDRQPGGCTVQTMCEKFLEQKRRGLATGEISQRSIDDYERTCAKITCSFSENRLVEDLTPDDFARLRGEMAENYGAVRLGNEVIRIRCVFKFAFDWGLIATPVRYGGGFSKPKAAVLRRERQKKGKRMFTRTRSGPC